MQNMLLAGTDGFIGSNFTPYLLDKDPEYHLVNLDLLTYAGNLDILKEVDGNKRYTFAQSDICDRALVESLKLKVTSYKEQISFVEDQAGHDRRYAIDATKLENELGWKGNKIFDSGIVKTIEWYIGKYNK